jgi:hypothetical protein
MRLYEVENPGEGSCAFYSFAMGLIDLVQTEFKGVASEHPIFDKVYEIHHKVLNFKKNRRYCALLDDKTLFRKKILEFNFHQQDFEFLFSLQQTLRFALYLKELDALNVIVSMPNNVSYIASNNTFAAFSEIVTGYVDNTISPNKYAYNHLVRSENIMIYAKEVATEIKKFKNFSPDNLDFLKTKITEAFLADIFTKDKQTFNSKSRILSGIGVITQDKVWGVASDLGALAEMYGVELVLFENGKKLACSLPTIKNKPTIRINNKNNVHWCFLINADSILKRESAENNSACATTSIEKTNLSAQDQRQLNLGVSKRSNNLKCPVVNRQELSIQPKAKKVHPYF